MREVDLVYRTMFAELCERVMDASFESDLDLSGRFVPVEVKGRRYWYFDQAVNGANKRTYVGPATDEEITRRVEDFQNLKNARRARRKLVSTLVRETGFPQPEPMTGDIVAALAEAGLFEFGGVLIGPVALQCLGGFLGVRLPSAVMRPADVGTAKFDTISAAVGESSPPVLDFLRAVDSSFRAVSHGPGGRVSMQFASDTGYTVELLTLDDEEDHFGDAPAPPATFLDFLIREPVRSVLLHRSGVPVAIPAPGRFAVHRILVAACVNGDTIGCAEGSSDLHQAAALASALETVRRHGDLAMAWSEAWDRGPVWREALETGISCMQPKLRDALERTLENGLEEIDADPAEYGLTSDMGTPVPRM
ncbi:GSU2403 family nucleotidyltransferase fold protein [Methylobacterium sp. 1030]|uniref:GSU2403 family nucleotidyltransferase fold protein n=1 Tax=Methylobacterium sp. 1030 TaxID=3156404 RepID=UPI003397080A